MKMVYLFFLDSQGMKSENDYICNISPSEVLSFAFSKKSV